MATSIPSYITVIFSFKDGQNIRAQVPAHFEPTDFIKIVQEKLGPAAVSEFYFSLNGEELLIDDLDAFKTQKDFITDNCTIVVNKSSEYKGEGCMQGGSRHLVQAWPIKSMAPDPAFTDYKPFERYSSNEQVSFFPVERKGANYLRFCIGWLTNKEKPENIRDCLWRYTSESGWFCTTINLALATDSPTLEEHGEYIKQLKYSIGMSTMNYTGTVYRGVDLSSTEVAAYESKDRFLIPSFTSTSKTTPFHGKNTIFHIDITPQWSKFCMEITPEFTKYPQEDEILFSCYNVYQYHRTEKCNGQRLIKLSLLDYDNNFNYQTNSFIPRVAIQQKPNLIKEKKSWSQWFRSWFQ